MTKLTDYLKSLKGKFVHIQTTIDDISYTYKIKDVEDDYIIVEQYNARGTASGIELIRTSEEKIMSAISICVITVPKYEDEI